MIQEVKKTNIDIVKAHQVKKEGTLAVVIPKEVRKKLGIKAGDKLLVSYDKQKRVVYQKIV